MKRAWALNFDASEELAEPTRYKGPKAAIAARFAELATRLGGLVAEGDVVLGPGARLAGPHEGWAFCPTPRALAALFAAGAEPVPAPPFPVLRAVNHRGFAVALGRGLEERALVRSAAELDAHLGPTPRDWLLKRAFGFAGRGRRKVRTPLSKDDRAWVDASLRAGDGLVAEPWVPLELDVAWHGWIPQNGGLQLGAPTVQLCDRFGAWLETVRADDALRPHERDALGEAAEAAAEALARAGYFGPFGIDGYRYAAPAGPRFVALSDLNARFTMGWATGFGGPPPPFP